jgi:hypothetical protein
MAEQPSLTWEDVLTKSVVNQPVDLPKLSEFSLRKWETRLKDKGDWEAWKESAYNTSEVSDLHNLIDWTIPRPNIDQAHTEEAKN